MWDIKTSTFHYKQKRAKLAPNLGLGFGHESNPRLDTDVRGQIGDPVIRVDHLEIDGLIPPRNRLIAEGTGRVWFVPSTF